MNDLFGELGNLIGTECRGSDADAGAAISELLVYLADQATVRTSLTTRAFIGGLLGLCDIETVDLTLQGRAACLGA